MKNQQGFAPLLIIAIIAALAIIGGGVYLVMRQTSPKGMPEKTAEKTAVEAPQETVEKTSPKPITQPAFKAVEKKPEVQSTQPSVLAPVPTSTPAPKHAETPKAEVSVIQNGRYVGTLVDAHIHYSQGQYSISQIISGMDAAGIDKVVLFGATDEISKQYPSRIIPFATANMQDQSDVSELVKNRVSSGVYKGVGELALHHFPFPMSPQGINLPVNSPNMHAVCDATSSRGMPVTVHIDNAYVSELEALLQARPLCKIIWAHMGTLPTRFGTLTSAQTVDSLFARYPNLYADISAVSPDFTMYSLLDANNYLKPEWRALFEKYPTRFFYGTDVFLFSQLAIWSQETAYWRKVLGGLSSQTAENIGYKNIEMLLP